jgi:ABC-2 type transport system permease protein
MSQPTTTPLAPALSAAPRRARTAALQKMAIVETKLFLRDKTTLLIVLALPAVLVLAFGSIPSFDNPSPELGGQTGTEMMGAIGVALVLAVLGLTVLPTLLATYRERGILRRLRATPVPPGTLLAAQLIVNTLAAIVAVAILLGSGAAVVGLPVPGHLLGFVLAFALGLAALGAVGLLIAALAPSSRGATGIGMVLFFPSMFLAGVYIPREFLPTALQRISDVTPLGAALTSFRDTWSGDLPRPLHLVTMAGYAVVAGLAAARFFRWE